MNSLEVARIEDLEIENQVQSKIIEKIFNGSSEDKKTEKKIEDIIYEISTNIGGFIKASGKMVIRSVTPGILNKGWIIALVFQGTYYEVYLSNTKSHIKIDPTVYSSEEIGENLVVKIVPNGLGLKKVVYIEEVSE